MGVTALGRGAFRQIWDEPKIHACVRGSALAAVLAPGHLVMPGRCVWLWMGNVGWGQGFGLGTGWGAQVQTGFSPTLLFLLENKSASSLFLPLAFQIHLGKLPWVLAEVSPARQLVLL